MRDATGEETSAARETFAIYGFEIKRGRHPLTYGESIWNSTLAKILVTVTVNGSNESVIYFDHNATTPLLLEARQAWLDACEEFPGNPSSTHRLGARADNALN